MTEEEKIMYEINAILPNGESKKIEIPKQDFTTTITVWHDSGFTGLNNLIASMDNLCIKHEIIKANMGLSLNDRLNKLEEKLDKALPALNRNNELIEYFRKFFERMEKVLDAKREK